MVPETAQKSRAMTLALIASGVLVVLAGGVFYYAMQTAAGPERGDIHQVAVGTRTCDPADFTLPAGRVTFEISNASDRPIEWEILDGVMVVEERENIPPGFKSLLTARLKPGEYEITCGLLSNPRGTLVVTPSAESEAVRTAPPITEFLGPLSEYKVYLTQQVAELSRAATALADAIRAGDMDHARALYIDARLPYRRIEPVAGRIADLENAIDPQARYLADREADPAFTGFHRIEHDLWNGKEPEKIVPVTDQLVSDIAALAERLGALRVGPADLADLAQKQADHIATAQIVDGENPYAGTDLPELSASLDGIEKAALLLWPLVSEANPQVADDLDAAFSTARQKLSEVGGVPYDHVPPDIRTGIATAFGEIATALAAINPAIGLE